MSFSLSLTGEERTSGQGAENDVRDPKETSLHRSRLRDAITRFTSPTRASNTGGLSSVFAVFSLQAVGSLKYPCWVCAVKGDAFQWVQDPPGNRSSRKQPEQSWR